MSFTPSVKTTSTSSNRWPKIRIAERSKAPSSPLMNYLLCIECTRREGSVCWNNDKWLHSILGAIDSRSFGILWHCLSYLAVLCDVSRLVFRFSSPLCHSYGLFVLIQERCLRFSAHYLGFLPPLNYSRCFEIICTPRGVFGILWRAPYRPRFIAELVIIWRFIQIKPIRYERIHLTRCKTRSNKQLHGVLNRRVIVRD